MKNKKSFPWLIVIVAAVVASLATVAVLLLRAKARKKRLQEAAEENECFMTFDCCEDELDDEFSVDEE